MDDRPALELFHPVIRAWFEGEIGVPTEAQVLAWPRIAAGENVLVSAPTGSGKTLTAFLWALDRLLTGAWSGDRVRVLYVSPLKALNTDVRRNVMRPLDRLRVRFEEAGVSPERVQVMTRSGDTPPKERRKMLRHPPEVLVTTPESLNILLASRSGRQLLGDIKAVILDEIHALAASKRGTHLITAVDRLVELSGDFQRIALSATVKPMERIAEMVAGYEMAGGGGEEPVYRPRDIAIVRSTAAKTYDVKVRFPVEIDPDAELDDESMWQMLIRDFRAVIGGNRSTLLFANSRRMTEKATRLLNAEAGEELAYSHHGSLSREVRSVVEKRLKNGQLRAIVATNSLELGIDVGDLDQVLLIQTPRSVAAAVQRVGRAGHGVGQVSRGLFYPTYGWDLLESAVVARAVAEQDIEEIQPVRAPLDVLAQVILSRSVFEAAGIDDLYDSLRTSWPYRHLRRRHYDLVLDMLAGRYADSRIRELKPRVHLDRVRGTVKARPGTERLLYMAGGTIADRGYFALRHHETMAKIGELDEEFVWERSLGDTFMLGTQSWRIQRITHNDVLVVPGRGTGGVPPFWRADAQDRGFHFCQRISRFLERAESRRKDPLFRQELETDWRLEPKAAEELLRLLEEQAAATGGALPRPGRLLAEYTRDRLGPSGSRQVVLHTQWGGRVNRPLAMALAAAWEEKYPDPLEVYHDDYALLVKLPEGAEIEEVLALVVPDRVEELLRSRLEEGGFFGSRFRWAAGTSLLLPKASFRQRQPLWMSRQKAKKLYDSVREIGDFPMVLESWRTCLQDEFEIDALRERLEALRAGEIEWKTVRTDRPSPFCAGLVHQYTEQHMYEDDAQSAGKGPGLRADVLEELVHAGHLRPRLPLELVERFVRKVQRLEVGYAPAPGEELVLWLEERVLVDSGEWRRLLKASSRDHEAAESEIAGASLAGRAVLLQLPGSGRTVVMTVESLFRAERAGLFSREAAASIEGWGEDADGARALARLEALRTARSGDAAAQEPAELVSEWLRFEGPVQVRELAELFDLGADRLSDVLDTLSEAGTLVHDELTGRSGPDEGRETEVCDAENLEILLRWLRSDLRPVFEIRPARELPLFLALHQGLAERGEGSSGLEEVLERLFGLALPAALWESEVLPARLEPYYPAWLDSALQQSELIWTGRGREKSTFCFESDLDLLASRPANGAGPPSPVPGSPGSGGSESESSAAGSPEPGIAGSEEAPAALLDDLFPAAGGGARTVEELAASSGDSPSRVHEALWDLAWRGEVSNETWLSVRQGLQNGFKRQEAPPRRAARASR
ncbi:MAG: DEAD/DEAH box helicase, partial [Acidobacteriota bacterium]